MRSKYRTFPEYHTSLDNLDLVTPKDYRVDFIGAYRLFRVMERNKVYRIECFGEPQLGKRGLYPTISTKDSYRQVNDMINLLAVAHGTNDLIDISNIIQVPAEQLYSIIDKLVAADLILEETKGTYLLLHHF